MKTLDDLFADGASDVQHEAVRPPTGHGLIMSNVEIPQRLYHPGAHLQFADPVGAAGVAMARWSVDPFGQDMSLQVIFRERDGALHSIRLTFCEEGRLRDVYARPSLSLATDMKAVALKVFGGFDWARRNLPSVH